MDKQHIESNCVIRDDNHDWGGDTAAPITESVAVTGEQFKKLLEEKIQQLED